MKCPKCLGKLSPINIGKTEIDRCFVCEGLWFDPDEIEELLEHYSADLKNAGLDSDKFDGKEAKELYGSFDSLKGKCPKCGKEMTHEQYKKITADYCPDGHGMWLDGGEINALKKIKQRNVFEIMRYFFTAEGFKEFKDIVKGKKKEEDI